MWGSYKDINELVGEISVESSHSDRINYSLSGGMVLISAMVTMFWAALACYPEDGCAGLDVSLEPKHVKSRNGPNLHELQGW